MVSNMCLLRIFIERSGTSASLNTREQKGTTGAGVALVTSSRGGILEEKQVPSEMRRAEKTEVKGSRRRMRGTCVAITGCWKVRS